MRGLRRAPLSRLIGASPARAAISLLSDPAQFVHIGDKRGCGDRPEAWDRRQNVKAMLEIALMSDQVANFDVEDVHVALTHLEPRPDLLGGQRVIRLT